MKKITLNPLQRTQAPCSVEVTVENHKVIEARCSGVFFRGFELLMQGRDPRDASYLTMRICGICSAAHGTAASLALEDAAGVRPPYNGIIMRNLVHGADILQNHLRNFYLYTLLDYVRGPQLSPFVPGYTQDYRLGEKDNEHMLQHYYQALDTSRLCHELVALLGGKAPFPHCLLAGGCTVPPTADILMEFASKLKKINDFLDQAMLPDVYRLAEVYADYYRIGCRTPNFLEFGMFPETRNKGNHYFPAGVMIEGREEKLNPGEISEHLKYARYNGGPEPLHPGAGRSEPRPEKEGAYSWVKAPRYRDKPLEGGPLSRLWLKGEYRRGVSTMDRLVARALEAKTTGQLMERWVQELQPGQPVFTDFKVPREAEGAGLTSTMRGPLGHWIRIEKGRLAHYQIITPTAWNFSPRDNSGRSGPVEEALTGIEIANEAEPVEIGRVIRAFDVCSSCNAHVITAGAPARNLVILP
ncbi:MAG: nickel-dependent hydrogenase large subunit [Bacillota bacterium]